MISVNGMISSKKEKPPPSNPPILPKDRKKIIADKGAQKRSDHSPNAGKINEAIPIRSIAIQKSRDGFLEKRDAIILFIRFLLQFINQI